MSVLRVTGPPGLVLAPQVVLGTADLLAAGLLALAALQPAPGGRRRVVALQLEGGMGPAATPVLSGEALGLAQAAALVCVQLEDSQGLPQVSALLVNAAVPLTWQAHLAAALVEYVDQQDASAAAPARQLVLAAALRFGGQGGGAGGAAVFPLAQPDEPAAFAGLPRLPGSLRVSDGFVAALVAVLQVLRRPAWALLAPGDRAAPPDPQQNSSLPVASALGAALAQHLGLTWSDASAKELSRCIRTAPDSKDSGGGDLMYM